jgi:hypothetical protein
MQRFPVHEVALGAIVAVLCSCGTARADDSREQAPALEAPSESERAESIETASPASRAPDEGAVDDALDRDPRVHSLRFADRRQVLMRLGLGGKFQDSIVGDSKAKPTYGATLRWDRPVHDYVTTGVGFSFYSSQPEGDFREPAFDISFMLKGRYPFEMGKRDRKFESEIYLLSQIGLTIWIDSSSLTLDLVGPGWNVGVSLGYQFFINNRVGLLAEVGWLRTEAFFSRGRSNVLLNQTHLLVGPVFPF